MRAKRYTIKVCESAMDMVHGMSFDIDEVCIPELGLFINEKMAFILNKKEMKKRLSNVQDVKDIILHGDKELEELAESIELHKKLEAKFKKDIFGVENEDEG